MKDPRLARSWSFVLWGPWGTYVLGMVSWLMKTLIPSSLERKMGKTEGGEHIFGTSFKQKPFRYSGRRLWCKQSDGKALSGRVCSSGGLVGLRDATKASFSVCPLIFLNIWSYGVAREGSECMYCTPSPCHTLGRKWPHLACAIMFWKYGQLCLAPEIPTMDLLAQTTWIIFSI